MRIKALQLLFLAILGGCLLGFSFPYSHGHYFMSILAVVPIGLLLVKKTVSERLIYGLSAFILLIGGMPFFNAQFFFAFVALIPLLLINFELNAKIRFRFWKRFGLNFLYFLIFNLIATWWIYNASPAGMYMAVITNSLMMCVPLFFTGFITRFLGPGKGLIAFVVLWLGFEYGTYYGEVSWPWLNFGHFFANSPKLIQWYEYSGVLGGTFWVLLTNVILYIIVRNIWLDKESIKVQAPNFVALALLVLVPVSSSLWMYYGYESTNKAEDGSEKMINVVCVQPNIDANTEKFRLPLNVQLSKMYRLAAEKMDEATDLVVFPETAIAYSMLENRPDNLEQNILDNQAAILSVRAFLQEQDNTPALIGAGTNRFFETEVSVASKPYKDIWYENYNSALVVQPNVPTQLYRKAKPVLGGEKVPFLSWFPILKEYSVELGGTSGMIGWGSEIKPQEASGFKITPAICYESVYGEYLSYFTRQESDIICVITNDGWYDDTPGHKQHCSFSQIRAIENRRAVVRSANTGISCLIDDRGEIISSIPWDEEGVLQGELPVNSELTFYVKYGDLLGRVALFLAIGLLIYAITNYVKGRGIKEETDKTDSN